MRSALVCHFTRESPSGSAMSACRLRMSPSWLRLTATVFSSPGSMVKGDIPSVPSAMATLMLPIMAIIKTEQRAGKCCNDVYIFLFMCVFCGKDKKVEAQQGTENEPVLRPRKESVYLIITFLEVPSLPRMMFTPRFRPSIRIPPTL